MASEYTENRRYPLYVATDKPNLRDQYNGAIREIDTDMAQALDDSSGVAAALGAGFDAQHTVRMAIDSANTSISDEVTARQNAVSAEATARENAVSAEATARANADTAINNKIGTGFSSSSTVRQQLDAKASTQQLSAESTARANADDALDTRLDALETSKYMVVIGDSFSDPNDGSAVSPMWPALVAKAKGLTVRNFAKGGSGFCVGGANIFSQQLALASSQISDKNNVAEVYVFGGINDAHTSTVTVNNLMSDARTLLNSIVSTFTKATVIVAGVCPTRNADGSDSTIFSGHEHRYDQFTEFLGLACDGAATSANTGIIKFIPMRNFPFFNEGFYQSTTNWHPSTIGHRQIASLLLGGSACHSTSNYSDGEALTRKPCLVTRDGAEKTATSIDMCISGNHTVSINFLFEGVQLGNAGSTPPVVRLNGMPSGPRWLTIWNGDYTKMRYLAGQGSVIGTSVYSIPSSVIEWGTTTIRVSYDVEI